MTDHNVTPVVNADYLVGSENDERRDIENPSRPYRMTWGDFEDKSLGAKFALAMEKLEGLMYALYGSLPIYDHTAPGDFKPKTWEPWERPYPRLMWGGEQYVEYENFEQTEIWRSPLEVAALGGVFAGSSPSVPIRSRSGDPQKLFAATGHNQDVFPLGSVKRATESGTNNIRFPHDPAGISSERHWPNEDNVKIIWEKPSNITLDPAKDPPKVYAKFVSSSGTSYASYEMTAVGNTYSCILPAQDHDTWCGWYVKAYVTGNPNPVYDPQVSGGQPVYGTPNNDPEHDRVDNQGYTFRWFSHYNPYGGGLPEMIDKWRKGTDRYLFDASEEIQPELINLVRYVLEKIVTDHHLEHNPKHRGQAGSSDAVDLCCVYMPIKFFWSGSNTPDMYISGGKDDTGNPLTNHPQVSDFVADEDARRSWRGHERVWAKHFILDENQPSAVACHMATLDHGDDETWRTWGNSIELEPNLWDPTDLVWNRVYGERGLKRGDVIDPIHVIELIEAIDYLIDEGCWKKQNVQKRKRSVHSLYSLECGESYGCGKNYDEPFDCHSSYNGGQLACDWWNPELNDGAGGWDDYPAPTSWENCRSEHTGQCNFRFYNSCQIYKHINPADPGEAYGYWKELECDPRQWNGKTSLVLGYIGHCVLPQGLSYYESSTRYIIEGSFYYLCGPDDQKNKHNFNGDCDDDVHGNGSSGKIREKTDGSPALCSGLYSLGNKFNDMEACKEIDPTHVNPPGFKTVTPVTNRGIAPGWAVSESYCTSVPDYDFSLRGAPGIGFYNWRETVGDNGDIVYEPVSLLCDVSPRSGSCESPTDYITEGINCVVDSYDYPVCRGDQVFVRVDLNKDSRGIPQLFPYPSRLRNPPDWRGPCLTHSNYNPCDYDGPLPDPPVKL